MHTPVRRGSFHSHHERGALDDVPPILVVEDEPLVRLVVVEALEEGGYSVVEVAEGDLALAQIDAAEQLRGLVTDIRLGPGADGWQIARRARERFPAIAVVYISGDSAAQWAAEGVPRSVVLQKPFASAELAAALAGLLISAPPNSTGTACP